MNRWLERWAVRRGSPDPAVTFDRRSPDWQEDVRSGRSRSREPGTQPRWLACRGAVLALVLAAGVGCGRSQSPPRYDMSGSVSYGGQPVPAGYLTFEPDASKGREGPGAQADIRDGRYQTPRGQGPVGGPHVVTIYGFDGQAFEMGGGRQNPQGMPLFPAYRVEADLPLQAATRDFSVPAASK
jgi:hypothetical protein